MQKIYILTIALFLFSSIDISSQNTLITDDPAATTEPSAVLNIHSDTKGLLIPRLTKTQRLAMVGPAEGLIVYETTNEAFFFHNGSAWELIQSGTEVFDHNSLLDVIRTSSLTSADFILGSNTLPGNSAISEDMLFYDNEKSAFRVGTLDNSDAWSPDSIGINSIGMGQNAKATGIHAVSIGYKNTADGNYSTAFGWYTGASGTFSLSTGYATKASGLVSTSMGDQTKATGRSSTAMGHGTRANSSYSTSIGNYNKGGGDPENWVEKDPLFEIGNGTSDSERENALTVLKNGDFIVGRHKLPETSGVTDTFMFYDKSKGALRGGRLSGTLDWAPDSIGFSSFAFGQNAKASGYSSTALGYYSNASGDYSTALGVLTEASGYNSTASGRSTLASGSSSTALGRSTIASGRYSTSIGNETTANSHSSIAIGQYNFGGGQATFWVETDPLFEIGNGTSDSDKRNAMTVLKNGDFIVGEHELPGSSPITNTLMFYDQSKAAWRGGTLFNSDAWAPSSIGQNSFSYGQNTKASGISAIALGLGASAIADYAVSLGRSTLASGESSTAMGLTTEASGLASISFGVTTKSQADYSTAMGFSSQANGIGSIATGNTTLAAGDLSSTFGLSTNTNTFASIAIGQYNMGLGGNLTAWDELDPVFVIGNGLNSSNRANALTVLKNGKMGLNTHAPQGLLHLKDDSNASKPHLLLEETGASSDYTRIKLQNSTETEYWNLSGRPDDDSQTLARFNINYSDIGNVVAIYGNGNVRMPYGSLFFGSITTPGYRIHLPNSASPIIGQAIAYKWETYSDARVKREVQISKFGLNEVMQLNPVSYFHYSSKFENGQLKVSENEYEETIGFIAQEVYDVIKEVVSKPENEDTALWSMDYEKLTPVLVKAIQEQQAQIDVLEKRLDETMILIQKMMEE